MNTDPHTDPHRIRAEVDQVLSELPSIEPQGDTDTDAGLDIDAVGRRLEEAHQILVDARESVEKG